MSVMFETFGRTGLDFQYQQCGIDGCAQRLQCQDPAPYRFGVAIGADQHALAAAAVVIEDDLNGHLGQFGQLLAIDGFRGNAQHAAVALAQLEPG